MSQKQKADFRDWMRPKLKEYYSAKINYLSSKIDEVIPENFEQDLLKMIIGSNSHLIDLAKLREAMSKPMRQYLQVRGKLFRPLICCICIEGYGGNPNRFKPILAISEIIHSCSLMLDDIADASLLRRGHPSSHHIYGIPRAANASSVMTFYALRLLRNDQMCLDQTIILKLYKTLLWEHYITSVGSALDLGWTREKINSIPEDEYIQHILFRSCSYTYRHAARIGAIVAGADDVDLKAIFQYSSLIGIAFQFIDDILNLKPELKSWGKTVGEDITEGKRSLLVLHAIKKASNEDRTRLLEILDGSVTDPLILKEGIDILKKYGAFEIVRKKADKYIDQACNIIQKTKISEEYKSLLVDFAYYVVERKI